MSIYPSSVIKFKAGFKLLCFISLLNLQSQPALILLLHISTQTLTVCIWMHSCHSAWSIFQIVSFRGQATFLFATVWLCRTSCYRPAKDKHQDMNLLCSYQGRANLKADNNSRVKPVGCQHISYSQQTQCELKHLSYPRPPLLRHARSQASCRNWCNTS